MNDNPLEKLSTWQAVANVGFSDELTTDLASELMSAPASMTTFTMLAATDIGVDKIKLTADIFNIPLTFATDATQNTYAHKLSNGFVNGISGHPNPFAARGFH